MNFRILYTHPFSILEEKHSNTLLSLLHCDVYHGVEVDILEDENLEGMFSARLSSRNFCPNSVLSKDPFLFCGWDFVLGCIDVGLLLPPLPPLLLFEEPGFTRIVKATDSRCTLEDSSSFQRSDLVSLACAIPQKTVKIRNTDYRSFLPFRATMNRT